MRLFIVFSTRSFITYLSASDVPEKYRIRLGKEFIPGGITAGFNAFRKIKNPKRVILVTYVFLYL